MINNKKRYYNPEYALKTDIELQQTIIKNFDDIKYMIKENIDITQLNRKELEDLYQLINTLYWICLDLFRFTSKS